MSDPIAAAEAAGKARDIANRFETAVFLIAYGIAEKDGLYEADPHRYPYSQAFRHGMNILAALCAECSDDAEELLPTFNESDFIRNSAASDVREWTARWRDECREAVEGCRSIEIGPLASVDGDYFAATSECYEVLRFAENDLLGGHQERRVYEFLRAGTQEQYVYGRRMLIRHPLLTWNEYVRIKTGLALGDPDPLDQGEADTIDPVWLQEFVSMAYEPVPGAAKVCPSCGWTMTMRGKQPHCSSATCAKAVTGDFDKLDSVAHDAFRLSRGVMHYISSPGKLELAIAEAAAGLGLKYEMWPLKDTCDILIHLPDGRMPCRRRQGIRPRRAACPRDRGRRRHRPDVRGRGGLCRAGPSRTGPSRISRAMQCRPARQDRLFMRNAAQLLETTRCRREGRHAMSEPNDTAQEGFDQLKRNLEVRYPEDSDLSLDEFLNVESLLALAVRVCGPGADPRKADRLLSNYQLIRPETIGADGHLMQMARRHLFSLASSTAWRRLLGLYERAEYERYRFFDIANGGMALREHPLTGIDRMPIYIDRLLGDVKLSHKNVVARPKGRYSYTCKPEATGDTTVTGSIRWVTIPDAVPPQTGKIDDIPRKSRRPPIDITLDELISTADEVGEKTGKTHYAAVLRRVKDQGLLKRARGGSTSVADGLRLDEVVSLVGLVGAGKSVLANMLIVCLAKRGLRAVSLLNSVSDVMESVVLLREAGISASPLVSRGRRIERLDEFFDHDDSMLLDHSASKYLETACIMDGLSSSDPEACGYGSTPCRGLRSKKGGANSCPYWDVCPSQAMARESLTSDVVVTTPTGFATMIVGRERKAFFEEALQQFDVVLFDEADRVQAQLDGCFAPSMSFQELIRNAADPTAVAMKRRPDDKMRDFNEELFYDLRQKSEPVAKALLKSVRDDRMAKWRIVKDEAFTSLSLLNDLLEQGLPKQVYEDADKLINPYRFEIAKKSLDGGGAALNKLSQAVATSCEGIDDDTHSYSLNEYLAACGCSELPDELRTRFSFALKVIRFDSYLRELASAQDLLSFKDDSVDELYNFLKFSYTRQQHYLPNSLIGNIFGMKLDGNDLRLFRQFAFGRAFMCSLPWLDTDPAGAALGPHVLLLSGSSWEPGCLQYHVNRPVDYLLEAEPWKAAKLSTSTVRDLGIEQNVSGSAAEMRSGNLGIVLSQTMATLRDELDAEGAGKALVIVNSYREAEDARDRIEQEFRRKGQAIKVAALVRNNHDHREHFVPRSEVYKFCDHPAKVLVAPAMAIERGFNIVDRGGHAVFTSLIFSVRPMGTPHDLGGRYRKLNGLIEREVGDYPANPGEFATEVRASAWRTWKTMERDENLPMGAWRTMGRQFLVDDAISTLMVTIIQIFGRLARLADKERPAPHVYFADAAFRGGDGKLSFRTLEELGAYMECLMHDSDQPEVAKALYGPFYESFRKGIGNVGL